MNIFVIMKSIQSLIPQWNTRAIKVFIHGEVGFGLILNTQYKGMVHYIILMDVVIIYFIYSNDAYFFKVPGFVFTRRKLT